ncbi:MAG: voltage-gated potassium channel, partial [Mycobacterium sp.]|nr:voltage-gated potassium channel [Mycobacterium sp.]
MPSSRQVAAGTFPGPLVSPVDDRANPTRALGSPNGLAAAGVAIAFLALYSVKVLVRLQGGADKAVDTALLAVYCIFVVDYVVRLYLADPRGKWFVRHLWELPII